MTIGTRGVVALTSAVAGMALVQPAGVRASLQNAQDSLTSVCLMLVAAIQSYVPGGLVAVALAGAIAMIVPSLASLAGQLIRTHRYIGRVLETEQDEQPEILRRTAHRLGLGSRIRLVDSPEFHTFCFGLWQPQVCLSTTVIRELPGDELEAILRHEAWHIRRRDPLRLVLANALVAGWWFMPLAQEFVRLYKIRCELAADAGAVRGMNDVVPLAGALHRAATQQHAWLSAQLAVGAFSALDARIDYLLDGAEPSITAIRTRPASVFMSAALLTGVAFALCLLLMSARLSSAATACFPC